MNFSKAEVAQIMATVFGFTSDSPIHFPNTHHEDHISKVIEAIRPNFKFFTIKKETNLEATVRLCCKFMGPFKLRELKECPAVSDLCNTPGPVDTDTVSLLSIRLNTAIKAFGLQVESMTKFAEVSGYAQLLSCSLDRAKQVAGALNIVLNVSKLPEYQQEITSSRPDLDKVNCALMLCYTIYTLSESSLLTLFAARVLGLHDYLDRVFDTDNTLSIDANKVQLGRQWVKCDGPLGWRLEDSLSLAVELMHGTRMPVAPGKTTMELMKVTRDNQQSLFCLTVADDNPVLEMLADSIKDVDGLATQIKEIQYAEASTKIKGFIDNKLKMLDQSSLQPKIKPIFSKLSKMVSDALAINKACDLNAFKAQLSHAMDELAPKSLLVEKAMIDAQKELNFSEMAEHALELEEIKTKLLANLDKVQQLQLNAPQAPTPSINANEADRPLYALYEEEIETLKCKLIDAELRETELKSKVDQLFSQNQSNANEQVSFDRCFNSATLRFLTGDGKVADVIDVMHSMRPDIVFCPGVREELECSIYGKPEKLLKGLIQLAGYHTATVSGQSDAQAMDILGNNYSANESQTVMSNGELSSMRKFKLPNGEIVEMQQHLTIGTRNGEAYTIQVHFRIIDGTLYIGRIGSHLPNSSKY